MIRFTQAIGAWRSQTFSDEARAAPSPAPVLPTPLPSPPSAPPSPLTPRPLPLAPSLAPLRPLPSPPLTLPLLPPPGALRGLHRRRGRRPRHLLGEQGRRRRVQERDVQQKGRRDARRLRRRRQDGAGAFTPPTPRMGDATPSHACTLDGATPTRPFDVAHGDVSPPPSRRSPSARRTRLSSSTTA